MTLTGEIILDYLGGPNIIIRRKTEEKVGVIT